MAKDLSVLMGVLGACIGSLWLVVRVAGGLGIPAAHLHAPTFVFSPGTVALTLAALFGPIAIVLLAHRFLVRESLSTLGMGASPTPALAAGIGIGLLIQALNYMVKGFFAGGATFERVIPAGMGVGEYAPYFAWFAVALVANSVSEELVFRAFPLRMVTRVGLSPWVAIVSTSVAFSAVHFLTSEATWASFLFRALYGALLCQIFLATGSFWLIAGLHTGTNLLASILADNWRMGGLVNVVWSAPTRAQEHSFSIVLALCLGLSLALQARARRGREARTGSASSPVILSHS